MNKMLEKIFIYIAICALIVLALVTCIYWGRTEKFFPEDEAHIVHRINPNAGISECKYQGMTPILTCSYKSKV
jgi:hypothetical protein